MNPVIYFDELDKISDTPRGEEIAGILTHLTDTSQNSQFHDKYFAEINFDLSKCLFIFSYNDESKVNPILKDRMYRIKTKGYSGKEKTVIANSLVMTGAQSAPKKANGVFHATKVHPGIEAWAKRTLVRDAKNRHWERVRQAARKVALAGNGDDRLRTDFFYDPSGKGATRCNEKIKTQFIVDLNKVLDLAASASLAIINIVGNPDCAFVKLKAMGKEEEDFLRLRSFGTDEPVVQVDHEALKILAGSLCKGADDQ